MFQCFNHFERKHVVKCPLPICILTGDGEGDAMILRRLRLTPPLTTLVKSFQLGVLVVFSENDLKTSFDI